LDTASVSIRETKEMISQAELSALRGQQGDAWILEGGNRPLLNNANEGITVVQDGMIRLVNPGLLILTGYSEHELTSRPFTDFLHPDDRQMVMEIYLKKLKGEETPYTSAFRVIAKGGSVRWTEMKTVLFTWEGKPAVCCSMSDITERRKIEQALADNEKRYRFLAENVSDVIWVIDMNLRPTYISPSITKMTGYSIEETLARGMERGLSPAAIEAVSEIVMAEMARKGEPNTATRLTPVAVEMERKDGSKIWAESAGTLLRGPDGQPTEIIGILHDITERKKAEETLQHQEQHSRALIEHSSDVILIVSAEGIVRYVSPSVEPILGFNPEEAIGTNVLEYLHQDALQLAANEFAKLLQNPGATMQTEIRAQHKDGTWRELEGTATNLLHDPAVEGIVINYRDITERKKAEETIQESARRDRLLAGSAADVIWATDANLRVTYVSPSVTSLFGYSIEEAMAGGLAQGMTPATLEAVTADIVKGLAQEGQPNEITELPPQELELKCKDGSMVWAWVRSVVTRGLDGQPSEIVGVLHDITERRRIEEKLKQQERHFRALIERSSDVIVVLDTNGTARYVSPSVEHALGITPAQSEGVGFLASIHPDDVQQVTNDWDYLVKHPGGTTKGERRIRCADGSWRYVEAIGYNLLHDPAVEGIVVNVRDINERKQAEEAIRKSEERYRLLAENLSDVIWTMDTNLKYTYISPSVTHLRGYTVEEAKTISMENTMTPASLEAAMRIMAEEDAKEHTGQYAPNRTVTMEAELYRKDGSTVWVENAITYLRDSSGQITGYLGVSRDIAERREATKELERSLQNMEKAMNGTVQAMALTVESRDRYTAGHQRRVAQLGCALARKLGFTSDQIQAIRIAGLLHDIGKISVPQEILSKPVKLTDIEFRLIKTHSQTGYDILKHVQFPWPIADIVVQHHERMNGSGYPSGIREENLLMEARILGVADVVEAMSSHRPYRAPLGIDKALEEISRNSGILYDPSVVDACLWVFNEEGFKFEV